MYRGSLTQCISYLGDSWKMKDIPYLSIINHPRAKYYSVCTDEQLADPQYAPDTGDVRLVFRGSRRELAVFMDHPQADLFKEQFNAALQDDRTDRKQSDGDATERPAEPSESDEG